MDNKAICGAPSLIILVRMAAWPCRYVSCRAMTPGAGRSASTRCATPCRCGKNASENPTDGEAQIRRWTKPSPRLLLAVAHQQTQCGVHPRLSSGTIDFLSRMDQGLCPLEKYLGNLIQ